MYLVEQLALAIQDYINSNFEIKINNNDILILPTKKEFTADFTFTSFLIAKKLSVNPKELCNNLGLFLKNNCDLIKDYNVVNGFLNISLKDKIWIKQLMNFDLANLSFKKNNDQIIVEFPSPNTNKPLHLGHLRNIFLGDSLSNILEYVGHKVKRVNLVNDRGIHICKSMIAYKKFGKGETPNSENIKGDHFVGKYYVLFETELKKELKNKTIENSQLMKEVKDLLIKWEDGDKETIDLWKKMNSWVYKGFDKTFETLNVKIDKTYYESQTYLLGKNIIQEGLKKGIFFRKDDTSVWIDLKDEGLDEKILLRSDGTSVYITQDLGTADQRYNDYKFEKSIYVVGNEQDYHFKILFTILKKLGKEYADNLFHLSYGMIDLPSGKMKSREGTVIDADNLVEEMIVIAEKYSNELGKVDQFSKDQLIKLNKMIALGALKYYILKIDPKKRILFNPEESIDFQGHTGPFIQYTYARINTLLEKIDNFDKVSIKNKLNINGDINDIERKLISLINHFSKVVLDASNNFSPSLIAQYVYNLAKTYNKLYADYPIIKENNTEIKALRLLISYQVKELIKQNLNLLGISSPNKM